MAVLELVTSSAAFWSATAAVFRANNPRTTDTQDSRLKEALIRLPYSRVTWICALFLLGYVGAEVALGGWIVKFMLEVRDGGDFASGMTATGFWLGITVGRLVLGFVTPKLGEKLAIAVCALLFFSRDQNTRPSQISSPNSHVATIDIPPYYDGPRADLLARPTILRLRRRSLTARFLPRPIIPRRRCRSYETAPQASAR